MYNQQNKTQFSAIKSHTTFELVQTTDSAYPRFHLVDIYSGEVHILNESALFIFNSIKLKSLLAQL